MDVYHQSALLSIQFRSTSGRESRNTPVILFAVYHDAETHSSALSTALFRMAKPFAYSVRKLSAPMAAYMLSRDVVMMRMGWEVPSKTA